MNSSMHWVVHIVAVGFVFLAASVGWMVLGGVTSSRLGSYRSATSYQVSELWGKKHQQLPPSLTFTPATGSEVPIDAAAAPQLPPPGQRAVVPVTDPSTASNQKSVVMASTDIKVDLQSDLRRKGLIWYSLYNVQFAGDWSYTHSDEIPGVIDVAFPFPNSTGNYDEFTFQVNGTEHGSDVAPSAGVVSVQVPVEPGETIRVHVGYRSRGKDEWTYEPGAGVGVLRDFKLTMTTDFSDIDFPNQAMSPTKKTKTDDGWALHWNFERVVTGQGMGVTTPTNIQPGELAAQLSFSAPISLLLFFVVMMAIAMLRGIDIHPVNYFFLAGSFFAFHLLFAYSVDHLPTEIAFALASAVSLGLVVSYLRLVVSAKFAFVEAAGAQLLYLIGFSLAHFWDGYTGLTVTVLGIVTLFALMQLTGRIRWSELRSTQRKSLAGAPQNKEQPTLYGPPTRPKTGNSPSS